ncbi:MOSC domain-containing protein [Saliphagus sp. LR7]|uniref:MOSC domain-containing protein n=1 Tax=Saliphagus sp. LR7 TaxID=2282654 RepID=UPI000DF7EFAB|nr:MOSC N-terminal beta barrel domain-containing protein [Saliphagus sp. LR7]
MTAPTLESIRVHPIKSLDATVRETARIVEGGGLAWDRRYAIVDSDGEYVNGKRERAIHRIGAAFDLEMGRVSLRVHDPGPGDPSPRGFDLEDDRTALEAWLAEYLGDEVSLRRNDEGGFPDDTDAAGPTVITSGTLAAVAAWFGGITPAELCRRLRPNLVLSGEAFAEDRLYDRPGTVVPFEIGGATIHGESPCARCVVPTRDPDTGAETEGFRERFVERRRATLPEWANEAQFDHYFRLMVNTQVPPESWGEAFSVGDPVTVGSPRSE